MSPDPANGDVRNPQSWNRFLYALGSPLKYIDPSGRVVSLAGLNDTEQEQLLEALSEATGNIYGVDDDGNLALKSSGQGGSQSASAVVGELINDGGVFEVNSCNGCAVQFAGADLKSNRIFLDFSDFSKIDFRNVTPGSFGLATHFLHEGLHLLNPDKADPSKSGLRGFFVDEVNRVREELGLDIRDQYKGREIYGQTRVFFESKSWLRRALGLKKHISYPLDPVQGGRSPL